MVYRGVRCSSLVKAKLYVTFPVTGKSPVECNPLVECGLLAKREPARETVLAPCATCCSGPAYGMQSPPGPWL